MYLDSAKLGHNYKKFVNLNEKEINNIYFTHHIQLRFIFIY